MFILEESLMDCLKAIQDPYSNIWKIAQSVDISEKKTSANYNNWKQAEHHQEFSDNARWSYMEQKCQICQTLLHYRFLIQDWMGTAHSLQLKIRLVSP